MHQLVSGRLEPLRRVDCDLVAESEVGLLSQEMLREIALRRRRFVYPLFWTTFVVFCLSLGALAYLPSVMSIKVWGSINLAYLLALAQFVVTFATAAAYSWWARAVIDPIAMAARSRLAAEAAGGVK